MELLTIGLLGTMVGGGAALGISKLLAPKKTSEEQLLNEFKVREEKALKEYKEQIQQLQKEAKEKEEQILKSFQTKEEAYNQTLEKTTALTADLKKYEAKEEAYEVALNEFRAKEEKVFKAYQDTFKELEKQQLTLGERLSQIQSALQNSKFEELSAISASSFGMLAMQVEQIKNALKSGVGFEGVSEFETRFEGFVSEFKREKQALVETNDKIDSLKEKIKELTTELETEKKFIRKKEEEYEQSVSETKKMIISLTDDLKNGKPFNINDVEVSELRIKLNALIEDFKLEKQSVSDNLKMLFQGVNTLVGTKAKARDKSY